MKRFPFGRSGPQLDLADIQGNVLRPYDYGFGGHLFLTVLEKRPAWAWLGRLSAAVTTAVPWTAGKPATTLNVGVTFAGLAALGQPPHRLATFPPEFRAGMAGRAEILGDTAASRPEAWEPGFGTGQAHVLLSVYARDEGALAERLAGLEEEGDRAGLPAVTRQRTQALPGAREHFGYDDGFGQPAVAGGAADLPAQGTPMRWGRPRPLPVGEFVLGYPDADREEARDPALRNGTYLVYRKLGQDVAGFRSWLAAAAAALGADPEWLAAKLVGRWRDGTPLVLSPDRPNPAISGRPERINDFVYRYDPAGLRCPIGAHIRRVNPRDALGWQGKMTVRHRIIRRGMPYGPVLAEGVPDDGVDRGLLFLCYNTSIERQFEFIQRMWCNDGDVLTLGDDRDPLVGTPGGSGKMTINGHPPRFVSPLPGFVTVRGGEYVFIPGIRGLRALTGGGE